MTDEERRIRGYLQAQGAKLPPAELIEKVRAAMGDLHAALSSVPGSRFTERPSPDEWSANEVMAHVVNAGTRFGEGITRALDGLPAGSAVADRIEAGVPTLTAAEWWEQLLQDRTALFTRVMRADPDAHRDRAIEHGMFGPLNWRETLLFLRLHDLDHAGQLRTIAARLA